jgi:hypothetical protein
MYVGDEISIHCRIKPAIKSLINEAELAAEGKADYLTYEDIFETADNNE